MSFQKNTNTPSLSNKAAAAIDRYSQLISEGMWAHKAIEVLKKEGYKTRNGKFYKIENLRSICSYAGIKFPKMQSQQRVFVCSEVLKKAMIMVIEHNLNDVALILNVNRGVLRNRLMDKYPTIYKKKNAARVRLFFLKTKEAGVIERNGFLFDKKFEKFIDMYTIVNNGNGYAKVGNYYFHRLALGASKNEEVDHIDQNKADNRLKNLRKCNRSQNSANRKIKGYINTKRSLKKAFANTVGPRKYFKTKKEAVEFSKQSHAAAFGEFSPYSETSKRLSVAASGNELL